ncbi:ABC transporter ATP-binding protein [Propylenella binzhouense]|uniref:Sn-glycerol-3-phosphate ABC transporter ATP-binding protein UgpC n=1 Tax=Propylenella binzhouense TaxID=2555902 RepID=A0A964T4X0_9HYPH|nr:sn-glycerol-3-phosphate ABC transporter ATP-binding protein UgpC [Propylenella binzhouense]MYZ48220.1 sn-glycerol-3-phosphate ABC transporter ATP-binding protein UgpC [Propylenella binzhouense]
MPGVSLRNIWKRFGTTEVLKGISLDLEEGEFVVLVGPSGCGKSTLLNIVAGLETLSEGDVLIGDRVVNDVPPKDRNIAMVFQSYSLYPTKTVRKNITFGMEIRRVEKAHQDAALRSVSELLHIDPYLERKPGQLSGGQRQRVAMARALVRDPDVFLFDEPLSNLDAKLRIEMRTEIKKLHKRLEKSIIYVTHDQIEAMTLASRIAVMDAGHIRQFAPPEEIYESPADLFVASFIGSPPMNIVRGRVEQDDGIRITVENDGGPAIRFPVPEKFAAGASAYLGKDVDLGLRPETVTAEGGQTGSDLFAFDRPIELVEPTGPDTMLVFGLGGQEVIARVRPEDARPAGQQFRFVANMAKAKLFDPETGRRI